MTEQPDRLVLDFLSRVGDAAYGAVPSRRRAAFLADVRRRVDAACREAGARTADEVGEVLRGFGAPEELVRAEVAAADAGEAGPDGEAAGDEGPDGDGDPGGDGASGGAAPAVFRERTPPPWRGGPDTGWLGARAGTARAVSVRPEHGDPITTIQDWEAAGRRGGRGWARTAEAFRAHPSELLVLLLYAASALAAEAAFLWVVGAAMVVLSRVWTRRDKWVLAGAPPSATAVAMVFWQGDAPYVDQIVLDALTSTGTVGLRLAAAACAAYLVARIGAAARHPGHRPLNPPEYPS